MRVLVVEDERDTAEALSWGLTAEGYVVDVAGNGVDGLWKATENAYDVIVLDVMLPGLDGYQVAKRLREAGRWTPILMLTAMDDDLDHAEGLDSGAEIADDGPGIPEEERERVFGRFVRLDASREQASGSAGLGLAIAREIASAHGATIVLSEADGGGTRAVVTMGGTEGAGGETTARSVQRSGQDG
jgi:CheY-like chemotaxis protein